MDFKFYFLLENPLHTTFPSPLSFHTKPILRDLELAHLVRAKALQARLPRVPPISNLISPPPISAAKLISASLLGNYPSVLLRLFCFQSYSLYVLRKSLSCRDGSFFYLFHAQPYAHDFIRNRFMGFWWITWLR